MRALKNRAVAHPFRLSPPHVVVFQFTNRKRGVNFFHFFFYLAVIYSQAILFCIDNIFDNFCLLIVCEIGIILFNNFFFFWYLSDDLFFWYLSNIYRYFSENLIFLSKLRHFLFFSYHSTSRSTCLPSFLVRVLRWVCVILQQRRLCVSHIPISVSHLIKRNSYIFTLNSLN